MAGSEDVFCYSDDDLDLYDDFIVSEERNKVEAKVVQNQLCQDLETENKDLKTQVSNLEQELEVTKKMNLALKRNISVLFKTAKLEIEGKNSLLRDLQGRYDSLIFRRAKRENPPRDTAKPDFLIGEDFRNPSTGANIAASATSTYSESRHSAVIKTANFLQEKQKSLNYRQPRANTTGNNSQVKLIQSTECISGANAVTENSNITSMEHSTINCEHSTSDKKESTNFLDKNFNHVRLLNSISVDSLREIAKMCNTERPNQGQLNPQKYKMSDEARLLALCKYKRKKLMSPKILHTDPKRNNYSRKEMIDETSPKPVKNAESVIATENNRKSEKYGSQFCQNRKTKSTPELQNHVNSSNCLSLMKCNPNMNCDTLKDFRNCANLRENSPILSEEANTSNRMNGHATSELVTSSTNGRRHGEIQQLQVESPRRKVPRLKKDDANFDDKPIRSQTSPAPPSKMETKSKRETKNLQETSNILPGAALSKRRTKQISRKYEEVDRRQCRNDTRGERPHRSKANEHISQSTRISSSSHRTFDSPRTGSVRKNDHRHGPKTEKIRSSHVDHSRKNVRHSADLSDKYGYLKDIKTSGKADFEPKHQKPKTKLSLRNPERNSSSSSNRSHTHLTVKHRVSRSEQLEIPSKKRKLDLDSVHKQISNDKSKLDLEDGEIA